MQRVCMLGIWRLQRCTTEPPGGGALAGLDGDWSTQEKESATRFWGPLAGAEAWSGEAGGPGARRLIRWRQA
ncbi:hypothetical protein NDU88_007141 [Pleurodeles waltl]|uniref:Uncharacterized protein n=1 Tax=Pleurodeles waltl TaxID=8319 RepID=A0AAV7SRJ0_PLEWA|nr:hypothetical protein NDU88_007138 [Pleurodeles waltl]KAJ1166744.1 hypothetical protein NDU88_007141 [Pleurodeles waltl]